VRCTWCLEVILFDVRFKNRGDLVTSGMYMVKAVSESRQFSQKIAVK
jgi:hypothetical protein